MNPRILFTIIIIAVIASWGPHTVFGEESASPSSEPVATSQAAASPQVSEDKSQGSWLGNLFSHRNRTDFEELEDSYQKALKYYNKKKMEKARKAFEKIERQYPDYKETRRYLTILQEEVVSQQKAATDEKYRQEIQQEEIKKEQWRKEAENKIKDDQLMLETQAEEAYKEARVLYDRKRFDEARQRFEFVEQTIPGYRQTAAFLKSIDQKMSSAMVHESFEQEISEEHKEAEAKPAPVKEVPQVKIKPVEPVNQVAAESESVAPPVTIKSSKKESQSVEPIRLPIPEDYAQNEMAEPKEAVALEPVILKETPGAAESLYQQALDLFNSERYDDAERIFWDVQAIDPNYKAVATYLKKIEEARKEDELRALDDQARQFANQLRAEHLAEKIRSDKDKKIAKEMTKAQRKEIENLHREAKKDYANKNYAAAKEKFEKIAALRPGYDSVDRYLEKIDAELMPEESVVVKKRMKVPSAEETTMAGLDSGVQDAIKHRRDQMSQMTQGKYDEALAFFKDKNYSEARNKFIQVEAMSPGYRETREYLARLDESSGQSLSAKDLMDSKPSKKSKSSKSVEKKVKLSKVEKKKSQEVIEVVKTPEPQVDDAVLEQTYQEALESYGRGDYASAQKQFENVHNLRRDYKDTEDYVRLSRKMAGREERDRLRDIKKLAKESESLSVSEENMAASDRKEAAQVKVVSIEKPEKKQSFFGRMFGKKSDDKAPVVKEKAVKATEKKVVETTEVVASKVESREKVVEEAIKETVEETGVDRDKIEKAYQEGMALYDQGNYLAAQDYFSAVCEADRKYKNAAEYLKKSKDMVAAKEKERLKSAKQLAKSSKSEQEPSQEQIQPEKKSLLKRMKFWKKSKDGTNEEVEEKSAAAPMPQETAQDEKKMARLKEEISQREEEDAERIAKLERRHKREQAEKEGLPSEETKSVKKKSGGLAKVFERKDDRNADLDRQRKELEKMVVERRRILQGERLKVQKEYEKSLEDLYVKAVKMEQSGLSQQAYKMFVEIDRLEPGYKDTQKYLQRVVAGSSAQSASPVSRKAAVMSQPARNDDSGSRDDVISSALDQFEKGM